MTNRRTFLQTALLGGPAVRAAQAPPWQWQHYGGDAGATRHAPLDQINRSNVKRLRAAWTHRTGDASARPVTTIECTPIVVDGVMYLTTPQLKVQSWTPQRENCCGPSTPGRNAAPPGRESRRHLLAGPRQPQGPARLRAATRSALLPRRRERQAGHGHE
jgi:hypothetical protein